MNLHTYTKLQGSLANDMTSPVNENIAPTASEEAAEGKSRVSFRLRRSSTALGLLNRGIANWYPPSLEGSSSWKDEEEQIETARKMETLLKNSHVFQKFKERVAESEVFCNPMATRLVLEEFLQQELLFVGKQGMIHRHSKLIKHLSLTQRINSVSTIRASESSRTLLVEKPQLEHRDVAKCDSDSSSTEDLSQSSWSEEPRESPVSSPQLTEKPYATVRGLSAPDMPELVDKVDTKHTALPQQV